MTSYCNLQHIVTSFKMHVQQQTLPRSASQLIVKKAGDRPPAFLANLLVACPYIPDDIPHSISYDTYQNEPLNIYVLHHII